MTLIVVFLISTPFLVTAASRIPELKSPHFNHELERLAKVLSPAIITDKLFYYDIHSETARHNLSLSEYVAACFESYVEMKLSPGEAKSFHTFLEFIEVWESMHANQSDQLPFNWTVLAPRFHTMISTRKAAILKLSTKSTSVIRNFIDEIESTFMETFRSILTGPRYPFMMEEYILKRDGVISAVKQMALKYKGLSVESRRSLESVLCARNVLQWVNYDNEEIFSGLYELFSDTVGFNVDELLKDNKYLTNLPIEEVKGKIKNMSSAINVPAQEYVDICSSTFPTLRLDSNELRDFNQTKEQFMGKQWGKTVYNSSEELLTILQNESAPFIGIVTRRWTFARSRLSLPQLQLILNMTEKALLDTLLAVNNREASQGNNAIKPFEDGYLLTHLLSPVYKREFEKSLCFKTNLEAILKKEIFFDEFLPKLEF